jgi:hypothetical protein
MTLNLPDPAADLPLGQVSGYGSEADQPVELSVYAPAGMLDPDNAGTVEPPLAYLRTCGIDAQTIINLPAVAHRLTLGVNVAGTGTATLFRRPADRRSAPEYAVRVKSPQPGAP